jgi:DNA-binding MarR family transcriptional regulator
LDQHEGHDLPEDSFDVGVIGIDSSPLAGFVGYKLRMAQLAVFKHFQRSFEEVDIRPAQYSVLSLIERNPGLKQSQISAALGIKRTNMVAMIDVLESRGLARRDPGEFDRRSHSLHLTERGQKLMSRLHEIRKDHEANIVSLMTADERAQLLDLLDRVVSACAPVEHLSHPCN